MAVVAEVEQFDGGKPMTLLEHLLELRTRLIWCALTLIICVVISSEMIVTSMMTRHSRLPARSKTIAFT